MADTEIDLLRSSLDLLVLKAVSWGPKHGYAINEWIESATGSLLLLEEGTLYPALQRLDRQRMGRVGEQPPREVLHADDCGARALSFTGAAVAPARRSDHGCAAA